MSDILPCSRRMVLAGGVAAAMAPGLALAAKLPLAPVTETRDGVTVITRDLSPRFLDFHAAAAQATPDARFALWKDRYGFAAVPPTPQGDQIARRLLDEAWPKYPAAMATIRAGAAGMTPKPLDVAVRVADLLGATRPLKIGVSAYVGGFETNAFTMVGADGPVVAVPIEMAVAIRTLILPHEMTHAVHALTAGLSGGYERALGRVVFEEGLAMRVTQRLEPGRPDWAYVGERPWFEQALARRPAIFAALAPALDAKDGETVFKFTMGQGATGIEREAYLAGWLVVGQLLADGATPAELARLPEADLPRVVRGAMAKLGG